MFKSLFHWKVFLNIIIAGAVLVGLVWLTFRWLEYHTNHGKEIPVPNVVNLPINKAIEALDDVGFAYEVDSFKYDPKYKPLQVLQVYPAAGSRVKGGRAILLKVNPKTWAKVQVPDILDKYKGLAFRQLEQVGLKVGDTIYEPNIQRDAVIRMQMDGTIVKPGMLLPRFSSIDLVIGTGPKRNVSVPTLVGLTVQEAKAIIANHLFEVGIVNYEDGKQDDTDIVYYQDPDGGSIRDQGIQIDLWASKKTPAELMNKIEELNQIYRSHFIENEPEYYYDEYSSPTYSDSVAKPVKPTKPEPAKAVSKPAEKKEPAKETTTAKAVEKKATEPKKAVEKTVEKAKTTTEKTKTKTEKPKELAVEKPKVNKVVIE